MQVVTPAVGGPADQAGIRAQDRVVAIGGAPTAGLSLYDVAERLQGPEGSQVELSVVPKGSKTPRTVTLTRCAPRPVCPPRWMCAVGACTCDGTACHAIRGGCRVWWVITRRATRCVCGCICTSAPNKRRLIVC